MSLGIVPLFSRLIIKKKEVKQVGLIIVPHNAKSMETSEGEIVAIGGEVDALKVGEYVIYGKYAGAPIEIDGNAGKYVIMNQEDVIAKVESKLDLL